jgi:hypothetical protein
MSIDPWIVQSTLCRQSFEVDTLEWYTRCLLFYFPSAIHAYNIIVHANTSIPGDITVDELRILTWSLVPGIPELLACPFWKTP